MHRGKKKYVVTSKQKVGNIKGRKKKTENLCSIGFSAKVKGE